MRLDAGLLNRYAVGDGPMEFEHPLGTVTVTCGGVSVSADVEDGIATITAAQAIELMPELGIHELDWSGIPVTVERVSVRYCRVEDVWDYGRLNGDAFERYPVSDIEAAIARAEEAIEAGTRRSFTRRAVDVILGPGLNELPVEDVREISSGELLNGRQARGEGRVRVTYGANLDHGIRMATVQLAASYIRPRVGAENVRGASMDGVYVSYTLATGEEGGETGLPDVDAAIASHRSTRVVIM